MWSVCYILFKGSSAGYGQLNGIILRPTEQEMLDTGIISYVENQPLTFRFDANTAGQWGGIMLINLFPNDPITYTLTYEPKT